MRFERIVNTEHEMYQRAMELYAVSFPVHEQREPHAQERTLRDGDYQFNLIYDGDTYVGLLLCWETGTFIYVEHFCILPEMRNRKYGERALDVLHQRGKSVILEIDPPVDDITLRRRGFYVRSGFVENPYPHVHPPYHQGTEGHALVVMSCPGMLTYAEYDRFRAYLERRVMNGRDKAAGGVDFS